MDDFSFDLFSQDVSLHEDLVPYLDSNNSLGCQMLRSPLVYSVPYIDAFNKHINMQYEAKKDALKLAVKKKKWSSAIFLHERPYRCDALIRYANHMSDMEFWEMASATYVDTENADQNWFSWKIIAQSDRPFREYFMNDDERKLYCDLPDEIVVYRGCTNKLIHDLSWTLSIDVAKWFANRFNQNGFVMRGLVMKKSILGYLTRRREEEICVLPEFVSDRVVIS